MQGRLRHVTTGLITAAALAGGTPAHAGTTTNTLPVRLAVTDGCLLQTSDLMFVSQTAVIGLIIDATTTLTVKCTPNTPYTIDIDDGLQPQGNNKRQMVSAGGARIPYNVYFDAARSPSRVWGKGANKNYVGNSGDGSTQLVPVYGRVVIAALIPAGGYKDTLTVTINF